MTKEERLLRHQSKMQALQAKRLAEGRCVSCGVRLPPGGICVNGYSGPGVSPRGKHHA